MKKATLTRTKNAVNDAWEKLQSCKDSKYLQTKYFNLCKKVVRMERELAGNQLKISK